MVYQVYQKSSEFALSSSSSMPPKASSAKNCCEAKESSSDSVASRISSPVPARDEIRPRVWHQLPVPHEFK